MASLLTNKRSENKDWAVPETFEASIISGANTRLHGGNKDGRNLETNNVSENTLKGARKTANIRICEKKREKIEVNDSMGNSIVTETVGTDRL